MTYRAADAFGVAFQGAFESEVVGGVIAHDVDHAAAGLAGVVQVGIGVPEARREVQQKQDQ